MKPPNKGLYLDECYRAVCTTKPAIYYNYSTRMHYCKWCATLINEANRGDALCLYGHELCIIVKSN